jgi:hypothetical protein
MGPCGACGQVFTYNAERVPVAVANGRREPVCADCVKRWNPQRIANGLEPIVPLPGAYEPEEV